MQNLYLRQNEPLACRQGEAKGRYFHRSQVQLVAVVLVLLQAAVVVAAAVKMNLWLLSLWSQK